MDKLREAVLALIKDIESMSCIPNEDEPDSGYWYGEFSEWEQNDHGEVVVEWPNLSISVSLIKEMLKAGEKQG